MHLIRCLRLLVPLVVAAASARSSDPGPALWTLDVGGVQREAWVDAPASAKERPSPLVFLFHGHGGTAQRALRAFDVRRHWPEAIVVCPQGLPTPGMLTDPEGARSGWQPRAGLLGDRDLALFDALLERLRREYRVDPRRIHAGGHSNGGSFTYVLWDARGPILASVTPSACIIPRGATLEPKPVMHLAGRNDELVKFDWQRNTLDRLLALNGGDAAGRPWAPGATLHAREGGPPLVAYLHDGGHSLPPDAPGLMLRFMREHPAAAPPAASSP